MSHAHRIGSLALLLVLRVLLTPGPAQAARTGEPPPLLPESTVRALAAEVSGQNARHTIQELSLHHRMRGSEGYRAAAEAIRERAEQYGLENVEILELPTDGEIFYGTQRSRPAWDARFAELWELEEQGGAWRDGTRIASWATRPITLAQDSASGTAEADLVDVGAGTSPEDYEGKDVAGKLVLVSSQPGAAYGPAVQERGAVGLVSYAQNQKSAWWGEDRNLVRWGHLNTFPEPETFAFMVTVNQARAWQDRLARGEQIRLRARVEAGQHPGSYDVVTAVIPGTHPDLKAQEIVYSCHLDHQRPGANDDASGCAAILEAARSLAKLVREGKIPPPRRTLRFVWPPEIEGTLALLNARPDLAARARAVIHLDMVGGDAEKTKAIFHVTRSPASLPTAANDVAEAFGRFVNQETYVYSATGSADYPLVDPEGSRQALQARFADFSMGSDHQVWTEGSFRVPAIYMNDWPDRYIHTHADVVGNVDPTKLLRSAFLAAADGYALARLSLEEPDMGAELVEIVGRHALRRTAGALERAARLKPAEARNLLDHHLARERETFDSIWSFTPLEPAAREAKEAFLADLEKLVASHRPEVPETTDAEDAGPACWRKSEPQGPLYAFGYSYLEDQLEAHGLERPTLLSYAGLWGSGSEYAYEVLNLVDGRRSVADIRDAASSIYGPIPQEQVRGFLDTLEAIDLIVCDPQPAWTGADTDPLAQRLEDLDGMTPPEDPAVLGAAGYAKVLCSAVFVSNREPEEARRNSAFLFLPDSERLTDVTVDREAREARVTLDGEIVRTARFHGDQGCVVIPRDADGVLFEPLEFDSTLPDASTQDWPLGDRLPEGPLPESIDARKLEAAVDRAFADPEALTAAFLVVHQGHIVAERYGQGAGIDTQLESWSMGKSLTATLVGRLVQEGDLDLYAPAPVPAWQGEGDPRSRIRVVDLLRMSSGLHFLAPRDPDFTPEMGYPEHMYIYTGAVDAFELSVTRPPQFPPGTEGRYRNSDPLTLGYLVRLAAQKRGVPYLSFPQRLLFDEIGIRRQVLEPDPYGNFLLTGYDYGTARNWARLGLLYLNDGVFEGKRLLPEGFADLVSTPAPAWTEPVYGGLFWLNRAGTWSGLPDDAYYMAGAGGQRTILVPSLDLVVVRLGHQRGSRRGMELLDEALALVAEAIHSSP